MKRFTLSDSSIPAVVIGLYQTSFSLIRSLGKQGIKIIGVNPSTNQAIMRSKYCKKVVNTNINVEDQLVGTLINISKGLKKQPVLYMTGDIQVMIVSKNRELLKEYFHFILPESDVVKTLINKSLFAVYAQNNGFNIPRYSILRNVNDMAEIAENMSYPCILKPAFKNAEWFKIFPSDKAIYKISSPDRIALFCWMNYC